MANRWHSSHTEVGTITKPIEFIVIKQVLKQSSSATIVSGTSDYLEAEFKFIGDDWDGMSTRWASFRKLNSDGTYGNPIPFMLRSDKIEASQHLNLSAGTWYVSLYGINGLGSRITTIECPMQVFKSGGCCCGGSMGEIGTPIAEQLMTAIADTNKRIDDINVDPNHPRFETFAEAQAYANESEDRVGTLVVIRSENADEWNLYMIDPDRTLRHIDDEFGYDVIDGAEWEPMS